MGPNLSVTFDGRPVLKFVQGEDRTFALSFRDDDAALPVDLAGIDITVGLSRAGTPGGTLKLRSGTLRLEGSYKQAGAASILDAPSHGLVGGEQVTVAAEGDGELPFPLSPHTAYSVALVTPDSIVLTLGATSIKLGTATAVPMVLHLLPDVAVTNDVLGQATLSLRAAQSAATSYGLGQGLQVALSSKETGTRLVVVEAGLDVVAQPWP